MMPKAKLSLVLVCGLLACNGSQRRSSRADGGANDAGGRTDITVFVACTAPDTDVDGLCDSDELEFGSDPNVADTDRDGLNDLGERQAGTNPRAADSDSDGISDGEEIFLGNDPLRADVACASSQAQATRVVRPVDIIVVVDNSPSMNTEIDSVETNINNNFANIIGSSGIDYRIIMIAKHGSNSDASICVGAPLSGHSCSPVPRRPTNSARYFHYSVEIDSVNSLQSIIRTYRTRDEHGLAPRGWSEWLRSDAFKVFVEFSDDNSRNLSASSFDTMLTNLDPVQFGTPQNRNYIFHSIIGIAPKRVTAEAYLPTEPVQIAQCTGVGNAENEGRAYQDLSRLTGGLRFPLCRYTEYDVIFRNVAMGVASGLALPCSFAVPTSAGQPVDTQRILLKYTPTSGPAVTLQQVPSMADCRQGAWYLDAAGQQINLCEATCTLVSADAAASIQVLAACGIDLD